MKNNNISVAFTLFIGVASLMVPHASQAYSAIAKNAAAITPNTAIYTITYEFGLTDKDIYMPVFAQRGIGTSSTEKKDGYSINIGDTETITSGNTAGIILSGAPIVDGMYKIAKGAAQKLTLLVIYTTTQGATTTSMYRLQATKVPYFMDMGNGNLMMQQLNPSELQYYTTPSVPLIGN